MAPRFAHETTAERTREVVEMLSKDGRFPEWVVTTAFYRAVHLIEALFATENPPVHSTDHTDRNNRLRSTRRYQKLWEHFRPLYNLSILARYLTGNDGTWSKVKLQPVLDMEQVQEKVVRHRLRQIEAGVKRLLPKTEK